LLILTGFIGGQLWSRVNQLEEKGQAEKTREEAAGQQVVTFSPSRKDKPQLDFFVMSFCPFGNQAEDGLGPVARLLGDKVDWRPHYIFSRVNLENICGQKVYSREKCQDYVDTKKYFPDMKTCQDSLYSTLSECQKTESQQLLMTNASEGYGALHGRGELNQNVREVCAWNQTNDKNKWWRFIGRVNKSCNAQNADQCWEKHAKEVGLDVSKIKTCFNSEAVGIIEEEMKVAQEHGARGSPTIFINGEVYPPEGAYQEGSVLAVVGHEDTFAPNQYRSPEVYKQAVCAAFSQAPDECQKALSIVSGASGGCN